MIRYKKFIQIEAERAETYLGKSGIKIDLSISKHSKDNVFWSNTMFIDENGDTAFIRPQAVADAFGGFSTKGQGEGYVSENGNVIRFFTESDVFLTITKDGKYIPRKGCFLGVRVQKPRVESLIILREEQAQEYYDNVYEVCHLGERSNSFNEEKINASTTITLTEAVPSIGDKVIVNSWGGIPLFSELNQKLDKHYYLISYENVMAEFISDDICIPYEDRVLIGYKLKNSVNNLILTKPLAERVKRGVVIACGPKVDCVSASDGVYFSKNMGCLLQVSDPEYVHLVIRDQEIIMKEEEVSDGV